MPPARAKIIRRTEPPELTLNELMTAIGLATIVHDALLRAAQARAAEIGGRDP